MKKGRIAIVALLGMMLYLSSCVVAGPGYYHHPHYYHHYHDYHHGRGYHDRW